MSPGSSICSYWVKEKPRKKPQPGNLLRPGIEPEPPGFAARRTNRYSTGNLIEYKIFGFTSIPKEFVQRFFYSPRPYLDAIASMVILRRFISISGYLPSECYEGDNAGEMSPGSSTESYPAFVHIELRENPGKNLNQVILRRFINSLGYLASE
ncbi:hypothetical protein ANN_14177 [Periplaneta americana]|uniref:Per a allergen n=1 Tax=Periplaneta americana TaxID=6978 RepID=A0ABQ8SVK8_PERAM|nr:hypothetical protein ANN_14177 [Periplaneta americana]